MDDYIARSLQLMADEQKRKDRLLRLLFLCGPPSNPVAPPDTVNNLIFGNGNNVTFGNGNNATVAST